MRNLVPLIVLLAACAAPQPAPEAAPAVTGPPGPPILARGLSCNSPIVIDAETEKEGIPAEHRWVRENYPGARWGNQSLSTCNGKPADVVEITTANGVNVTLYFDISNWFGK